VPAPGDVAVDDVEAGAVVELGVLQALGGVELAMGGGGGVVEDLGERPQDVLTVMYIRPLMRVAIYARQSKTREGSASLAMQVDACREAAARMGLEVVAELVEPPSTSGFKNRGRDRPQFLELLHLVRTKAVDGVVAYESDRLSRGGGPGWAPLLDAAEEAGIPPDRLVAVASGGWLSEFELTIRGAMDRDDSNKLSYRMREIHLADAKAGKPRRSRVRPFGYESDAVTVREDEARLVREAVERVLAGESLYAIAADWENRGVPTVAGGRWRTQTLRNIVRSPRIAGWRSLRGDVVVRGAWDPIIEDVVWRQVLVVTDPRTSRRQKAAPRTYALLGFAFCGRCGERLRSVSVARDVRSYACRPRADGGGCGGIRIRADPLENLVRDHVVGVFAHPKTRERVLSHLVHRPLRDDHAALVDSLNLIEARRAALVDLYLDGGLTKPEYMVRRADLDRETNEIEERISSRLGRGAVPAVPTTEDELMKAWSTNGIDYQRALIALVVDRLTIMPASRRGPGFEPDRVVWTLR
jgi:site-specific DNA recombinase